MNAKHGLKHGVLLIASVLSAVALAQSQTPMQPQADPQPQTPSMGQSTTRSESPAPMESSGSSSTQSDQSSTGAGTQTSAAELTPQTIGDVTYLCGGVGQDEASRMKQAARDYGLMLTFAARNGSYLADVNVDITDSRGKSVLKAMCGAPIMLVDLPKSGTYRVHAEASGYQMTKTARVQGKGHTRAVVLVWPTKVANTEQMSGSSGTSGTTGMSGSSGTSGSSGASSDSTNGTR